MEIRNIACEMTWDIRHSVMWPNKPPEYVRLPNDQEGFHYGLFVNDVLVSVISIFKNGDNAQFRKFATLSTEQGKGYGSKLLSHVFTELKNSAIVRVWCNARSDKADYYKRFGMVETEKRFEKGEINYVIMDTSI